MNPQQTIYQRFNIAVDFLLKHKIAKSKKEIALSLGVSAGYFNEIIKERLKISAELLQIFFTKWPINTDYILGFSAQISSATPATSNIATGVNDIQSAYSPQGISEKLTPKPGKKLTPTLTPAGNFRQSVIVTVDNTGAPSIALVSIKARQRYLQGLNDKSFILELPNYRVPRLEKGNFRAFEVGGNSMVPTAAHNDIVVGQRVENIDTIVNNSLCIIVTKSDGILIKRVLNRLDKDNLIICKSDNADNGSQYPSLKIEKGAIIEAWAVVMLLSSDFSSPQTILDRLDELEAQIHFLKGSTPK